MPTKLENLITKLQSALDTANALPPEKKIQESKSITPSTSAQTVQPDSGYDGLGKVTVNAMPTGSVGTPSISIDTNGKITATAAVDAGYVDGTDKTGTKTMTVQAAKTVTPTKSSQTAVAKNVYTTGVVTVGAIPDKYQDVSGVTATAATTLTGSKFVNSSGTLTTGTMANNGSTSKTIDGLETKSATIPAGYTSGGTVSLDSTIDNTANAQAAKIAEIAALLEGKSVGGGTSGSVETCTVEINDPGMLYYFVYEKADGTIGHGDLEDYRDSNPEDFMHQILQDVKKGSLLTLLFADADGPEDYIYTNAELLYLKSSSSVMFDTMAIVRITGDAILGDVILEG